MNNVRSITKRDPSIIIVHTIYCYTSLKAMDGKHYKMGKYAKKTSTFFYQSATAN